VRTRCIPQRTLTLLLATVLALGGALGGAAGCKPVPADSATGSAAPSAALGQLDELTVGTGGSMKNYSRDRFPHWRSAGGNCDVRDSVLRRDGTGVALSGCNVVSGHWHSAYDDKSYDVPTQVDIDHMVPLANAWRSGAAEWTDKTRGDFANDLDRPQLLAVSASSNRAKGDQDPSRWRPPNRAYWCKYAQDWITVKHYWKLSVTSAEKSALTDMLETCG
jgi:hypothetical protein